MAIQIQTARPLSETSLALLKNIEEVFADPRAWLEMENVRLTGRRPIDLIGTAEEDRVRGIIDSIRYGLFS